MGKTFTLFIIFAFVFVGIINLDVSGKKYIIKNSGNTFVPNTIAEVEIGDTIRWEWVSGTHTTTSLSIPSGALSWDEPISSSSNSFEYVIRENGTYNFKCTPHESVGMIGSFTVNSVASISDFQSSISEITLYPNPAKDQIHLSFEAGGSNAGFLRIRDMLGKVINETSIDISPGGNQIDVQIDYLRNGIYFLEMNIRDKKKIVKRFIKKS
ncbi:MAG: T9SS type A sorting domain-containing protein [Bacteroidales bacterium]|nr:T9SS type A sorting domain-containing protein [Bacteroidales bacterium]